MSPLIRRGVVAIGLALAISAFAQPSARILHGPYLCAPTETAVTVVFVTNRPGVPQIDWKLWTFRCALADRAAHGPRPQGGQSNGPSHPIA